METWVQLVLTVVGSVSASSGLWAYVQHKDRNKSATSRLLMGIAYDTLVNKGMEFIERGWVTTDEFDEYEKFYFQPYKDLGGNGTAERIMNQVRNLPFHTKSKYEDVLTKREYINNVRVIPASELRIEAGSE